MSVLTRMFQKAPDAADTSRRPDISAFVEEFTAIGRSDGFLSFKPDIGNWSA